MATVAAAQTVHLIRHGEKPSDGGDGLSAQGEQRAQCLRTVFGASSNYNVGHIIAEQPKPSWSSLSRLKDSPLSPSLGMEVNRI